MIARDGGTRLRSLAFTSLGHFINDGEGFLVPVIATILAAQKGLSPLEVTIMFLAFYSSSSMIMPVDKYRGISLHKDLVGTIEEYIKTYPEMGYKSLADFATDAIREKCEKLGIFLPKPSLPVYEHFNLGEGGVRVLDRTLANKSSSGKVIDVYFRPEGIWCSHCQADTCRHIDFALKVPSIREIVVKKRREGWKLPSTEE